MKPLNDLTDILSEELQELYAAEKHREKTFPEIISKTENKDLKRLLENQLEDSAAKKERIEKIFSLLGEPVETGECRAIDNMLRRAKITVSDIGTRNTLEAALIMNIQCINHYSIAAYGTLLGFAEVLERQDIATLLKNSLMEEQRNDRLLTNLAMEVINKKAHSTVAAL